MRCRKIGHDDFKFLKATWSIFSSFQIIAIQESDRMNKISVFENFRFHRIGVWNRVRNHDKNPVVRSCTISCKTYLGVVHESCATKIVRDKNRARQKSCMNWVLIRKNFRYIVLKYVNFTKLDHLESILINVSACLEKN